MTDYPDYPALIRDLHGKLGSLQAVADALGESKATWSLIANGKRDPTRAQMNAIRAACGMEPLPPEPVEIKLHDEPDAALLVNLQGKAPSSVTISTDRTSVLTSTTDCRVTLRNVNSKARNVPDGYIYYLVDNIVAENAKTRKPTGKHLVAYNNIAAAARRAALALDGG